jgi:hypothetical protein
VYNWRILLGGVASATILTVGVAAPAFAQSVSRADTPTSSLSGVKQTLGGSGGSVILCNLPSLPMAGPEASAAAGAIGAPCDPSASTSNGTLQTSSPASDLGSASSALAGLNSVSGSIPDLNTASNVVPGLGKTAGTLPAAGSVTGASSAPADNADSSGGTAPSDSSGSSATSGLGSVTGAVNNVTGSLPGGSSSTGTLPGLGH